MACVSQTSSNDSSTDSQTQEDNSENVSQVQVRGIGVVTRVRKLTQNFTKKITLEWDPYGKPWDKLSSLMESYIGYLARTRVPIVHRDWRKVPNELKQAIFESIAQAFEIPDNVDKGYILKSAGEKWKDFKKVLTREAKKHNKEPPAQYDFIDQATWDEFLRQRCTKDFQELSAKNSDNAKKVEYHYRLSRKGYRRKARDMIIEKGENPATSSIPRVELWLAARQMANGTLDPEVKRVALKIVDLKDQESQGLIKPTGRDDLLSKALGKDDHPSRVRGVGFGVTPKQYFGENKRRRVGASQQAVIRLENQLSDMQNQIQDMAKVIMQMQAEKESQGEHINHSRHDSCSLKESRSFAQLNKGEWRNCKLYWPDLTVLIAKGRAFIPEVGSYTLLHGKELDSMLQLKVTVNTVVHGQEHTKLPYSSGDQDVTCIEDAIGGFIAWPKDMVIFVSDNDTSKGTKISTSSKQCKNKGSENAKSKQCSVMSRVSSMSVSIDKLDITIDMPENILHHEHFLHFGKRELDIWLEGKELEAMHVAIYMRCLYENHNSSNYAFLCSERLALPVSNDNNLKTRAQYMVRSMLNSDLRGRLWFAPYNEGLHWMLAVIDPLQSIVYWLDPLGNDVRIDFKNLATKALHKFYTKVFRDKNKDIRKSKTKKREVRWKLIQCPIQLNNYQCGYYICRYMREIIERGVNRIPKKYFEGSPTTYRYTHIDDIRTEWLEFVELLIKDEINQH